MFNKKLMITLLLLIITFGFLSVVSAQDINSTDEITTQDLVIDDGTDVIASENLSTAPDSDDSISDIQNVADDETELIETSDNDESDKYSTIDENPTYGDGKINATITAINTAGEYKAGKATFKLTDTYKNAPLSNRTIDLKINGDISSKFSVKTDSKGIATFNFKDMYAYDMSDTFKITDLTAGKWSITVSSPDENLTVQALNTDLTVTKATIKINVKSVNDYYGTTKKLTIKVTYANTGEILQNEIFKTYISNTKALYYYTTTGSNGIMTFTVNTLYPGVYNFKISPNETANIKSTSVSGKIKIKGKAKITLSQSGSYYKQKKLTVKVVDKTLKQRMAYQKVKITFSNGKKVTLKTNSNGVATYKIPFNPGNYWAKASASNSVYKFNSPKLSKVKIAKIPLAFKTKKLTTTYKSGKYFKVKVIKSKTKKPAKGIKVNLKIYTGKKAKTVTLTSNSKGMIKYSSSKLNNGKHKVIVKLKKTKIYTAKSKKSYITINKEKVVIKPKKLSTSYKSGKYFKAKVIKAKNKKPAKKVKISLKVYTGKKAKRITLTTNSKGMIKYSSSKLNPGKHKVILKVKKSKYYTGKTKKSSIKISKASLKIIAPAKTNIYKKYELYKVTVKNKGSNKPLSGIKVTMKVYTGNKYKKYTAKTNSKGEVSFSTKSLSKATHKIDIYAKGNKFYYSASAKSSVRISTKIATSISVDGSAWISSYSRPVYQQSYPGGPLYIAYYNYYYNKYLQFTPTLKGADGHELKGNYKAQLTFNYGEPITLEGKYGEKYEHYGGSSMFSRNSGTYVLTIKFAGNSKYSGSSVTKTFYAS